NEADYLPLGACDLLTQSSLQNTRELSARASGSANQPKLVEAKGEGVKRANWPSRAPKVQSTIGVLYCSTAVRSQNCPMSPSVHTSSSAITRKEFNVIHAASKTTTHARCNELAV